MSKPAENVAAIDWNQATKVSYVSRDSMMTHTSPLNVLIVYIHFGKKKFSKTKAHKTAGRCIW